MRWKEELYTNILIGNLYIKINFGEIVYKGCGNLDFNLLRI
jgi:hypothetical protein